MTQCAKMTEVQILFGAHYSSHSNKFHSGFSAVRRRGNFLFSCGTDWNFEGSVSSVPRANTSPIFENFAFRFRRNEYRLEMNRIAETRKYVDDMEDRNFSIR